MTDYVVHKVKLTFGMQRRIRIAAAERGTTMQAVITEALRFHLGAPGTDTAPPPAVRRTPTGVAPVADFTAERCEYSPEHETPSHELYEAYAGDARGRGLHAVHHAVFGAEIRNGRPYVRNARKRHDGKLIHVYRGIRLRPAGGQETAK